MRNVVFLLVCGCLCANVYAVDSNEPNAITNLQGEIAKLKAIIKKQTEQLTKLKKENLTLKHLCRDWNITIPENIAPADDEPNLPKTGTLERLQYEVKKALGDSNRGVTRISRLEESEKCVVIEFAINGGSPYPYEKKQADDENKTVRTNAKTDIVNIIKAVRTSGFNYSDIVTVGTFSLIMPQGDIAERIMVTASFPRYAIDRVSWRDFNSNNIYSIAEEANFHKSFKF